MIIEDAFVENLIKTAQWWKERINGDIESLIIKKVVEQMSSEYKYFFFSFDVDKNTASDLGSTPRALCFIVSKKNVTLRNKWKKVRIKKGSFYEGLNDNPVFIRASTEKYNTDYNSFVYCLPVKYEATLWNKEDEVQTSLFIMVDIPFSDIEEE